MKAKSSELLVILGRIKELWRKSISQLYAKVLSGVREINSAYKLNGIFNSECGLGE